MYFFLDIIITPIKYALDFYNTDHFPFSSIWAICNNFDKFECNFAYHQKMSGYAPGTNPIGLAVIWKTNLRDLIRYL